MRTLLEEQEGAVVTVPVKGRVPVRRADQKRAVLVSVLGSVRAETADRSLDELQDLAVTCGFTVVGRVVQKTDQISRTTFVGSGKLEEISAYADALDASCLIFDAELTPAQMRGITSAVHFDILDRVLVILSIFAKRARTDEGKIQVALAYYRYSLMQLAGQGIALSRLGGGIGTRGPGETKLEQDRRVIRKRMSILRRALVRMEARRGRSRLLRVRRDVVTAAIVGYTNAGKTTLLNRLSGDSLTTGDRLFVTLDPTARRCDAGDGLSLVVVDTVGFIRDLPEFLEDAFRATFEEAACADLLLIVADASDSNAGEQIRVVDEQLRNLGAGALPKYYLLNKMDEVSDDALYALTGPLRSDPDAVILPISAKNGSGIDQLRGMLARFVGETLVSYRAVLPYQQAGLAAHARECGTVTEEDYGSTSIRIAGRIRKSQLGPLMPWLIPDISKE